jgi:hypothetical protein
MGRACSTNVEKRNAEEKRPHEDLDVDGRIILKWTLDK